MECTYNEEDKILQIKLHEIQLKQNFLIVVINVTRISLSAVNI